MNERRHNEESSTSSITDHNDNFCDNVNLNSVDCSLEFLNSFSPDKVDIQPHLSNSSDPEKRDQQVGLMYNLSRQMAETSNANLIRNADYLLASAKEKRDNSEIAWVGPIKQRYDSTKFKLTYRFIFQKTFNKMIIVSFIFVMNFGFEFCFI